MDTRRSYEQTANSYAAGVRALFMPAPSMAPERGAAPLAPPPDLAAKAEELAPISSDLTQAALVRLASDDAHVRAQASTDLLAKALSDLEVSRLLLEEAEREEGREVQPEGRALESVAERGAGPSAVFDYLDILTHKAGVAAFAPSVDRAPSPGSIDDARTQLGDSVAAALEFIPEAAAKTGQNALNGLLGLGLKNLGQAAGAVGIDVAQSFGLGERVSRLYQLFQSYVTRAYEAIIAVIGNQLAKTVADKVVKWFEEVRGGKEFARLLNELYQTTTIGEEVAATIQASTASIEPFIAATTDVTEMRNRVEYNIGLADKLVTGLGYLTWVPVAVLPQAQLLLGAGFVALGAYVILAGGDAVDAPALKQFDYMPGVKAILESRQI